WRIAARSCIAHSYPDLRASSSSFPNSVWERISRNSVSRDVPRNRVSRTGSQFGNQEDQKGSLTPNALQLHDGFVPLLGEFLTDKGMILVEPEVNGARRCRDKEAVAIESVLADRNFLEADVLQIADIFLAGVGFEDRDLFVVKASVGESPVG